MKKKTKNQHPHWPRILTVAALVLAALACSTTPTYLPDVAPTQTTIPTWTPTPRPMTGAISGQVIDASSSSPIPNANVTTDPPTVSVTADAQGRYVIPAVPPGVYTITAEKPGYASASVEISVTAGKTTTADVHLMTTSADVPSPRSSLADGLVAYYPFNGNANDESGSGNHGIVNGATLTPDRLGNPDSAYSFDGVDDYIESSSNISLDTTFSVALWFKYAGATKGGTIFHRGYGGWCWYEPNIVINESSMIIAKVSGCDNEGAAGTAEIVSGEWYQVAIVARDGSQEFYVNGKVIGSTRHTNRYTFSHKAFIGVLANQNTPTVSHFRGTIDDVRIYNRALSESEIQALYREDEDAGLVAYYPFNGNADDESGNENHGTVHGATLTPDRFGNEDKAYYLSGADDHITFANTQDLIDAYRSEGTFSIWVKPAIGWNDGLNHWILGPAPYKTFSVYKDWNQDYLTFKVGSQTLQVFPHVFGGWKQGTWYHIVAVWENVGSGSNDGRLLLYVDGEQVGSLDNLSLRSPNAYAKTYIGVIDSSLTHHLNGTVDDVRIYNRALSEGEVQTLYREGEETSLVAYYPFNGNADDESGNGYHGTVHGATLTSDRFGTPNSAYSFDGTGYIATSLNMTRLWNVGDPIHLSLWIKSTATTGAALAGKPGGGPDFTAVMEPDGSGRIRVRLYGGVNAASDFPVNDGQWHHICWGTNETASYFYIDGKPQSSAPSIGSHNREIVVMFGASKDPPKNYFNGTIDDVRIYTRALSEAEILALYEGDM